MKNYLAQYWGLPWTWLRPLIVVLLILGIFFRFANLDTKVYWHDEALTSLRISGYTQKEVMTEMVNGNEINLLSSAALLRAIRLQTQQSWIIYAVTVVLGLYTHLGFGLVAVGHGVYVIGNRLNQISLRTFRCSQGILNYLIASFLALLMFSPWILILIIKNSKLRASMAWIDSPTPSFIYLIKTWILQFSSIFFDPSANVFFNLDHHLDNAITYFTRLPILFLIGYAIYILCRQTHQSAWLFVLTLIGVTGLVLILPDAILRLPLSSVSRYLIPCYLGIELVTAYVIYTKITSASIQIWQQKLWNFIFVFVIICGIFSSVISSQSEVWWNKYSGFYNLRVAHIVNQSNHPLLISHFVADNFGNLLSLSHLLDPKVQIQLVVEPNQVKIKNSLSNVFLYNPSQSFYFELKTNRQYKIEPIYKLREFRELWRVKSS